MKKIFEPISHTADIQIRAFGSSLEELFCNALKGMFLSIGPITEENNLITLENVPHNLDRSHSFSLEAPKIELLFVDFLSEAWYLSDIHNEAYFDAVFTNFSPTSLQATINGISVSRFEVVEIKAVTYHDLKIEKVDNHWLAEVVFDI